MVGFVLSLKGNTGFQQGKKVIREEEVLAPGRGGRGRKISGIQSGLPDWLELSGEG